MAEGEIKLNRTLVEVLGVDTEEGIAELIIPGWQSETTVYIPAFRIQPRELLDQVLNGGVLLAKVNLDADGSEGLMLQDFKLAPPPVAEGQLG